MDAAIASAARDVLVALADAGIVCFEAKYRFASGDRLPRFGGRPRTGTTIPTDPEWLPLLWTSASRRFRSFRHAADEAGMSRVFGGIHFVHAVEDGLKEGKAVGREVARLLQRVR